MSSTRTSVDIPGDGIFSRPDGSASQFKILTQSHVPRVLKPSQGGVSLQTAISGRIDARRPGAVVLMWEDEYNWNMMAFEQTKIMILNAAGRHEEAQVLADEALDFVETSLASGSPFPDSRVRYWYSWATLNAAQAGDREAADKYRELSLEAPADGAMTERRNIDRLALADAVLGNPEAGWERIARAIEDGHKLWTPEYVSVHPQYLYLFADVPGFQAYIADANVID